MAQSSQLSQIFKSRENILKQMEYQGYDISNYEGFSMGQVNAMFQAKQMDMLLEKQDKKKYTSNII